MKRVTAGKASRQLGGEARRLADRRESFGRALLTWYRREGRDLPWRRSPDLYRTVVSEFMLQQTQVATVLPYFDRWMEAFPDFETLAGADPNSVAKRWEGLGYYARARNLQRLARTLVDHPDPPPSTAGEWRRLPGVGPYTAAAVTSIIYRRPEAAVDGNVVRILARLTADGTPFPSGGAAAAALAPLAQTLVDAGRPGDHNQAMMELGATVCTRRSTACHRCPVESFCAARRKPAMDPEQLPVIARPATRKTTVKRLWVIDRGRLLLHRHPPGAKRLGNLFELPGAGGGLPRPGAARSPFATRRRAIGNLQIEEHLFRARATERLKETVAARPELHWVPRSELAAITLSGPHRKWIEELLGGSEWAALRSS